MRLIPKVTLFILAASVLSDGCAGSIQTRKIGKPSCQKRILIASEDTDFKNEVTESFIEEFAKDDVYIEIVDISKLPSVKPPEYSAVIVMNSYTWFSMDGDAKDFVEMLTAEDKRKVVFVVTAGTPSIVPDDLGVDAISCASESAERPAISENLHKKLHQILSPAEEGRAESTEESLKQ